MSNQKQQQKPGTPQQGANPLQSLKDLKNSLMGVGGAGAGSLNALKKIIAGAGKKLNMKIPHADFDSLTPEQKKAVRLALTDSVGPRKKQTPSSPNLLNRAKGGMVKKKKPKKAGRLAKRGYGAAKK